MLRSEASKTEVLDKQSGLHPETRLAPAKSPVDLPHLHEGVLLALVGFGRSHGRCATLSELPAL